MTGRWCKGQHASFGTKQTGFESLASDVKPRHARCHYCPQLATTRDHIVPRGVLRKIGTNVLEIAVDNIVPACVRCNNNKGSARSNCDCEDCLLAWAVYGPSNWQSLPCIDPATATPALPSRARRRELSYAIGSVVDWTYDRGN